MRGSMRERRPGVWELIVQLPRDPTSAPRRPVEPDRARHQARGAAGAGRPHRRGLGRQGHLDGHATERAARPLARPRQRAAVPDHRARVPASGAHDDRPRPRQAPAAAGHHPAHRRLLRQPRPRARTLAGVHPARPRRPPGFARPGGAVGLDLVERSGERLAAQAPPPGDHAAGDARPHATLLEAADEHAPRVRRRVARVGRNRGADEARCAGLRWSDIDLAGQHRDDPAVGGLRRRRHGRQGDEDPRCSSHRRRRRDVGHAGTATGSACSSWQKRAALDFDHERLRVHDRRPDGSQPLHPDTITGGFQTALPARRPRRRPAARPSPPPRHPAPRRRRPGADGERSPRPRQRRDHVERLRPLPRGERPPGGRRDRRPAGHAVA